MRELKERPAGRIKRIGGQLCLDFANTVAAWKKVSPEPRFEPEEDKLTGYADLLAWSLNAGILEDAAAKRLLAESNRRPDAAAGVALRARGLRTAVYGIGWRLAQGGTALADELRILEGELRRARAAQRLQPASKGLEWRFEGDLKALDRPLGQVALSAEAYFTTGDLSRLHVCPGEDCGWLFEDKTRNRSRQWCDMGDCGNIAKVRRFRSKRSTRDEKG